MSLPDCIALFTGDQIPPVIPGLPHRLALLPAGVSVDDIGGNARFSGLFAIDPDCAGFALNDPALAEYLRQGLPVLVYAARARDLRPFLKRAESFKRRGYGVELLASEAHQ